MWRGLLLLASILVGCGPAAAVERPLIVENATLPVTIGGGSYNLPILAVREAGREGRLPVAVITHGQAAESEARDRVSARQYLGIARDFARRGWFAVVVIRRGFGTAADPDPYVIPTCRGGDFAAVIDSQTDDIEAALRAIAKRPEADPDRVIALGVSVGGAVVLNLAARKPPGLQAVVNVSGGIRVRTRDGSEPACRPADLVPVFARMGERRGVPSLWIYAENDSFFPGDYVRGLHAAFVTKGGRTDFHMLAAVKGDGHDILRMGEAQLRWQPLLDGFLRERKLPTFDPAPLDRAASSGIRMADSGKQAGLRRLILRYHGRPTEKVVAVSVSGKGSYARFGGPDLDTLEAEAIAECEKASAEPCRIRLRNFDVVEDEAPRPVAGLSPDEVGGQPEPR